MSHKIDNPGFRPLDIAGGARRPDGVARGDGATSSASQEASTGETVSLTRSGVLMQRLEEALANSSVVDPVRVGAIRTAIASGAYQIDAAVIADRMIHLDRELS